MSEEAIEPVNLHLKGQAAIVILTALSRVKNLSRLKLLKLMAIQDIRYLESKKILIPDNSSGICYYSVVVPTL